MKISNILKKDARKVNNKIKPYEKDPRTYDHHERLIIIAVFMAAISIYTKYINFGHWINIGFDMSSYPPQSALFWIIASGLAFLYGYYKKDKILELLAMLGIAFALIFTAGIINTYYFEWVWW